LVAISIVWRFGAIDRDLDDLSAWTRDRLRVADGRTARTRRALLQRHRDLQALIVDLPSWEGSLDHPSGYFASRNETRLYRRLARQLQLGAWRTRIDERIEILEGAVASLVDDQRHRQLLSWELTLESLILLALVGDIGVHIALTLLE